MRKLISQSFLFIICIMLISGNLILTVHGNEVTKSGNSSPFNGEETNVVPANVVPASGEEDAAEVSAKKPKIPVISTTKLYIVKNKKTKLKVKNVKASAVTWTIEDPSICSIDRGKVTALSYGKTKITATIEGYEGQPLECTVIVQDAVKKLSLTMDTDAIYCRSSIEDEPQSQNISIFTLKDAEGNAIDNTMAKWTVKKSSYATIEDGVVTAASKKALVTVTASYGGKKVSKKIRILPSDYYTGEPVDPSNPGEATFADAALLNEVNRDIYSSFDSNVIYVSQNGSDDGDGTEHSPYKTIQKAIEKASAGDTICLREGTYEGLIEFKESGSIGQYITLCSAKNEKAVLTGKNGENGAVIRLNDCSYIRIENLEITDHTAVNAFGILMDGEENHVVIKNNHIHHLATTKTNKGGECNGILMIGYEPGEDHAIHDVWIEGNEIDHNTTGWSESLSTSSNCRNINVINNEVHDNTNIGIDFYGNAKYCKSPAYDQPRYCVARDNTVYNNKCGYAECAGIYVDGSRDILIVNNIVKDNMYGIEIGSEEPPGYFPVKNIYVLQNQISGNTSGGIRVGGFDTKRTGTVKNTVFGENVLTDNGSGEGGYNGEINIEKCDHILFRGNIVKQSGDEYPVIGEELAAKYATNITFENNVYMQPYPDNIYFEFHKKTFHGVDDFNAYTGGTDRSEKLNK